MNTQRKIKPPSLVPGDEIRLITTARKITPEELRPAIDYIQSLGFIPVEGQNLYAEDHQFGGTDAQRLADFQAAIDNPNVKAVLCVRGGYGTARLVDEVDYTLLKKTPKWIIGYSDITALHSHLNRCVGICSLHATMPINFQNNTPQALKSLSDALSGECLSYSIAPHELNRAGDAEGELVGGNLSVLYSLTGTASDLETSGKILFLEDLDEYLYHVDRMMLNLRRAGKLSDLKALIVGGMTAMRDNAVPFGKTAEEIIREAVDDYNYPVYFGFPAGHIENNCTLVMGAKAKLAAGGAGASFTQQS